MSSLKRIVVLISGNGNNLQAIIDSSKENNFKAEIIAVISNKPDAYGLKRAEQSGIATHIVNHLNYPDRESFDQALSDEIEKYQPDIILLAGFMRILTDGFVEKFQGRLLNVHPSLLPKYPGLNTYERAIESGDKEAGTTVHFVTSELDAGPGIIQAAVKIGMAETVESLKSRVQKLEYQIYPIAVQWCVEGRVKLLDAHAILDNEPLQPGGYRYKLTEENNLVEENQ